MDKKTLYIILGLALFLLIQLCTSDSTGNYGELNFTRSNVEIWDKFYYRRVKEDEPYSNYSQRNKFDFYRPVNKETDKVIDKSIPLIIVVHSGAFLMGDKRNYLTSKLSKNLSLIHI